MVLKWRPDGDRGLIAAEAAPSSPRPPLLSGYFLPEPRPSANLHRSPALFFFSPPTFPPSSSFRCRPDRLLLGLPSLPLSRIISAIVSFPLFFYSLATPPLFLSPTVTPLLPFPPPSLPRSARLAPFCYRRLKRTTSSTLTCSGVCTLPA